MARQKITAATRERRKHEATRDKLWHRLRGNLQNRILAAQDGSGASAKALEALFLLDTLRETGAK